jgi:hypothetical protein
MRSGDFNINGYPDIFLTIKKQNKKTKQISTESLVLINMLFDKTLKKDFKDGWPNATFSHV